MYEMRREKGENTFPLIYQSYVFTFMLQLRIECLPTLVLEYAPSLDLKIGQKLFLYKGIPRTRFA